MQRRGIPVLKLVGTLLLLSVAGCAGIGSSPEERATRLREYVDAPQQGAGQQGERQQREEGRMAGRAPAAPPPELETALSSGALSEPLELRATEPRFDLTVDSVPAQHFFQGIVEDTAYNVVVHPEVEGRISMTLKDVSVPEIMEVARDVYGYNYQRTDTAYLILPPRLETRLFRLDYLNVARSGESSTRITTGEIAKQGGGGSSGGVLGSRVTTSSSSNLWQGVEQLVERIIASDHEDAEVVASPEAGTLAVRATQPSLRKVEKFIERLQNSLNRQVILEARVVEIELGEDFRAGLEWGAQGTHSGRVISGDVVPGASVVEGSGFTLSLLRDQSFSAVLRALESKGNVQVLSSPQVSTLNNQKAVIKAGTDEFYQTGVNISRQTINNQRVAEVEPDFEPFFSGIALDVTPQIGKDGWITLHIQPSVTEVRDVARSVNIGGGTGEVSFRLAQSDVRQSDSIVRARDGEMIVIGGMIEEREEESTSRVPLLGRIPLIGSLFTYTQVESSKYELVILLRPRLVDEQLWVDEVERRMRSMERSYTPE